MNNPQAFPLASYSAWDDSEIDGQLGMTLRDYFAAKAMQQMIVIELTNDYASSEERMGSVARISYKMADAMLKERSE